MSVIRNVGDLFEQSHTPSQTHCWQREVIIDSVHWDWKIISRLELPSFGHGLMIHCGWRASRPLASALGKWNQLIRLQLRSADRVRLSTLKSVLPQQLRPSNNPHLALAGARLWFIVVIAVGYRCWLSLQGRYKKLVENMRDLTTRVPTWNF